MSNNLKYSFTLIFSFIILSGVINVKAQTATDTTAVDSTAKVPKKETAGRQITIGVDIVRPIENALVANRMGYEFAADYYLHKETYAVVEGGWGSSTVNYSDLKYSTTNTFVRLGFNKMLLPRVDSADWGGMLMGLRLAAAPIKRSQASYTVVDSLWGNSTGTLENKDFAAYWMELTLGVRVELIRGFLAGWNLRGKFLLNEKQFNDLSPLYIAGYGRGDKNAVFDFNFYLSYAVRWHRKQSISALAKADNH